MIFHFPTVPKNYEFFLGASKHNTTALLQCVLEKRKWDIGN